MRTHPPNECATKTSGRCRSISWSRTLLISLQRDFACLATGVSAAFAKTAELYANKITRAVWRKNHKSNTVPLLGKRTHTGIRPGNNWEDQKVLFSCVQVCRAWSSLLRTFRLIPWTKTILESKLNAFRKTSHVVRTRDPLLCLQVVCKVHPYPPSFCLLHHGRVQ